MRSLSKILFLSLFLINISSAVFLKPSIEIYSIPTKIGVGEKFKAIIYINNPTNEKLFFKAYTFAYEDGECVTKNCWENYLEVSLDPKSSKRLVFNNSFLYPGEFIFKARINNGDSFTDSIVVESLPKKEIDFLFLYNNTHIGYTIKNKGDSIENISITAIYEEMLFETRMINPTEEIDIFFERKEGWLYLFNGNELLDSRSVWEYQETPTISPTGVYVANPNDLNILFVFVSIIGFIYLVWKI